LILQPSASFLAGQRPVLGAGAAGVGAGAGAGGDGGDGGVAGDGGDGGAGPHLASSFSGIDH